MKKLCIALGILMPMLVWSQDNGIESEILAYDEGKSTLISKGRQLLIDKFLEKDFEKVKETERYLTSIEDEDYFALYPAERWLIQYWVKDYEILSQDLSAFNDEKADSYQEKIAPGRDLLYAKLIERSRQDADQLIKAIEEAAISEEEKTFLRLNFNNLIADYQKNPYIQDSINTETESFLEAYPQSQYNDYARQYIRLKYKPSSWGFAFEFFSGYGFFTKELHDYYKNPIPVGVAFDVCYNKFELYLRDYIGITKTAQSIDYSTGSYMEGSSLQAFLPEISLGYASYENNRLKVAPFVGIGSMSITPPSSSFNESPYLEEITLDFTTTYVFGFGCDFKLGTKNTPRYITHSNYAFIRLRYSYNLPQFDKKYENRTGAFHNITIGFGGIGRRLIRDL